MSTTLTAQINDLIPKGEPFPAASGHSDNSPTIQGGEGAEIVAELIAQKSLPEIFGLVGLVSNGATQEKLLAVLPLLPWYPADASAGGIWREE